eukprot:scaffold104266_cov18-Tisochrysis_lutea.AAC.1
MHPSVYSRKQEEDRRQYRWPRSPHLIAGLPECLIIAHAHAVPELHAAGLHKVATILGFLRDVTGSHDITYLKYDISLYISGAQHSQRPRGGQQKRAEETMRQHINKALRLGQFQAALLVNGSVHLPVRDQ